MRSLALSMLCTFVLLALPLTAQDRAVVGAVIDVDEGRGRIQIEADDEAAARLTIETDAVATTYHGFGTMIAGKPEIFVGSKGLANVRLGDRLEVRGSTRGGVVQASRVTLLGRAVEAGTVGVGDTRPPTSVATPTDDRATGLPEDDTGGVIEGVVRQINLDEGRIVVQTRSRIVSVNTYRNTPVHYRGEVYRVRNLEVGDRVRVEADPRDAQADEITARRIDVTRSVQEATGSGARGMVGMLAGRVTRIEPGLDYIYVQDGRREVRVDMRQATDAGGAAMRAADVRVGEEVEISGSYSRAGDIFRASTVRYGAADGDFDERAGATPARYGLVTISGTVTERLDGGSLLTIVARDTGLDERIWTAPDLVIQTRAGSYETAESLRANDEIIITAFQDPTGTLVAQTIRVRSR